jgi:hypothetical protein
VKACFRSVVKTPRHTIPPQWCSYDALFQTNFAGEEAMKIQHTEFAPNPALRNTITHLPPHIAHNLIAQGVAIHIPYKNFVEYMNANHREGRDPNNVHPPQIQGVEWSCTRITDRAVILRKSGGEVARIETLDSAIQYGAPDAIIRQFTELENAINGLSANSETTVQEQYRAAARKQTDAAGMGKLIFGR